MPVWYIVVLSLRTNVEIERGDDMNKIGCVACVLVGALGVAASTSMAQAEPNQAVGVVCNIKVLTPKVPDVSSLEDWKKAFIKDGVADKDKALAIFNTEITFQNADAPPPAEFLQREDSVLDPIKLFNVYGYTLCSVSAANMACLARYAGLKARNSTINNHVIPEFYYDGAWHMLDADLIEYFPKADGSIASLQEIVDGIQAWLKDHPDFPIEPGKKAERYKWMNEKGWKANGPEILSRNPFYDDIGWLPSADFAWGDTMQQFAKIQNTWQSCYSQGYRVNVQLRAGETLTRNWFNKGLHVNMLSGVGAPASLAAKVGQGSLKYSPRWGDIAPGRVGNGTLAYDVPLASGAFRAGALMADNLAAKSEDPAGPAVHVKDAEKPGVLDIRMASSYVYLGGEAQAKAVVGEGGEIRVLLSDNNGIEWKDLATIDKTGDQKLDLKPLIGRRYVYVVRFVMKGKGTGLDALKLTNDIQHSQRPLPALVQGDNTVTFSAGAQEGTITIEGAMEAGSKGKQVFYGDYHPTLEGFAAGAMPKSEGKGSVTFPVKTPGDMARLRVSDFFLSQGKDSMFLIDVSFDNGTTWKTVDQPTEADLGVGPRFYVGRYVVVSDVPAGTRSALVRYRGTGNNTIALCNARIDADYKEPAGGFRPVQVTYVWEEGGIEKKDVHVAKAATETYTIKCESAPLMKSLILELAK